MQESREDLLKAVFEEFGGKESFFRESQSRLDHFNHLWSQDIVLVGRVLRAHLVVEHFLTEYIEACNPRLPSLAEVRLSFENKVKLLPPDQHHVQSLVPGIRRLNIIRNRIAHRLEVEITNEDRSSFLGIPIFAAQWRAQNAEQEVGDEPIDVVEGFAKFAATWLQGGADGTSKKWERAMVRTYGINI